MTLTRHTFALGGALLMVACSAPTPSRTDEPVPTVPGWEATVGPAAPVPVTLGVPYQPDVQFAPLYVALEKGYFTHAGVDVSLEYGDETDYLKLVAKGEKTAVIAGGDQLLLARAQDVPAVYVATWYERFPVAVFDIAGKLHTPSDLVGKTVGLPMRAGTTYLGWQALLAEAGIDPDTVTTEVVGFDQVGALERGEVDAAAGYAVNEPVQLAARGHPVSTLEVADTVNLVSNGLIVSEATARDAHDVVQGLVDGLLRGIDATIANPDEAFAIALRYVPEAASQEDVQRQVLQQSLRFWQPAAGTGAIDPDRWAESARVMTDLGLLESPPDTKAAIDPEFVAAYAAGGA